jgi:hypothetical protein
MSEQIYLRVVRGWLPFFAFAFAASFLGWGSGGQACDVV